MRAAGGFRVARRLVIREDDLDEHERLQSQAVRPRQDRRRTQADDPKVHTGVRTPDRLKPGWWRLEEDAA
jgi:hypothetical protein